MFKHTRTFLYKYNHLLPSSPSHFLGTGHPRLKFLIDPISHIMLAYSDRLHILIFGLTLPLKYFMNIKLNVVQDYINPLGFGGGRGL